MFYIAKPLSMPAWHASDLGSIPGQGMSDFRCKNLALNISDCLSLVGRGGSVI